MIETFVKWLVGLPYSQDIAIILVVIATGIFIYRVRQNAKKGIYFGD